jgi:hypothetical protein
MLTRTVSFVGAFTGYEVNPAGAYLEWQTIAGAHLRSELNHHRTEWGLMTDLHASFGVMAGFVRLASIRPEHVVRGSNSADGNARCASPSPKMFPINAQERAIQITFPARPWSGVEVRVEDDWTIRFGEINRRSCDEQHTQDDDANHACAACRNPRQ